MQIVNLAIGVTTAPRRTTTLRKSLVSLKQAGFGEKPHLFAEPGTQGIGGVHLHQNEETKGCFPNTIDSMQWMLDNLQFDWLLMCQDDVMYSRNARKVIEQRIASTDVGYYTLYLSNHQGAELGARKLPGFYEHKIGWHPCYWGNAIAWIFPRASVELLLNHPITKDYYNKGRKIKLDCLVCKVMLHEGKRQMYHVPSLAQHIGYTSTVGNPIGEANKGYKFSR